MGEPKRVKVSIYCKIFTDCFSEEMLDKMATGDEIYEFLYGLVRAVKPKLCLESGTFEGDGSIAISQALTENGDNGKLYTIDEKDFGAKERLTPYSNIEFVLARAPQIFNTLPLKGVEFIFLDSGHSYVQVINELRVVDALLAPEGYICIHDVLHESWGAGSTKAIQDFIRESTNKYSYMYLTNFNGLGILQKMRYT